MSETKPPPPKPISGWLMKKKRGTIFFNKYANKTFWVLDTGRLNEYALDKPAPQAPMLAAYQHDEPQDSSSPQDLLSSHEVSSMVQVWKEKSDEILIVFMDDSTIALRCLDTAQRDAWLTALNGSMFRPPNKSTLTSPRRSTLLSNRISRRSSMAATKERLSAHFSKAQLLAKQINKRNDDSILRKRGSKERQFTPPAAANAGMRVIVVPSIAHEERVDAQRFVKTDEQRELLLLAINRDLLPIAATVFATAHVTAEAVVDLMFSVEVAANTDIIVQGEASDRMFVIEFGDCGVYSQDFADQPPQFEILKTVGQSFGLLALLYTQPAPFMIRSEAKPARLWALPRNQFFELNRNLTRKKHGHKLALLVNSLKEALESVFHENMTINTLEQIADSMEFQTFRLGQVIVHKGDVMNKLFIVDEGEVLGDVTLSQGDVFGAECLTESEVTCDMTLMADTDEVTLLTINAEEVRFFFGQQQEQSTIVSIPTKPASGILDISSPPSQLPTTPKKRTKATLLVSKHATKKFTTPLRELSAASALVFVEEVEEDGVRLNLDLPFDRTLPRLRPEINDLDMLDFVSYLGRGQFGTVHLVEYKQKQERFALKVLQGNVITLNGWEEMVQLERDAMIELAHSPSRFLCKMSNYFSDRKNIYFLLEYVDSGTLQDHMELHLKDAESIFQTVPVMQFYLAGVVLGLEAIHGYDICYRDLKPENMMMSSTGYCKLADFGLAKKSRRTFTFCGSPQFMAPETILNRGHGLAVDWWASGIFLFEMLCGYSPFAAYESSDTFEKILAYNDNPTPAYLGYPKLKATAEDTAQTRNLIENLLLPKQNKRLGVRFPGIPGIKRHAFFEGFDWDKMEQQTLQAPFIPQPAAKKTDAPTKKYDPNLFAVPDDMTGWVRKF